MFYETPPHIITFRKMPTYKISVALGYNVRRYRREQHLSKTLLARMCGIGRPLLNKIESGESDIRISYVQRIADALSVSPLDLLILEDESAAYLPESQTSRNHYQSSSF